MFAGGFDALDRPVQPAPSVGHTARPASYGTVTRVAAALRRAKKPVMLVCLFPSSFLVCFGFLVVFSLVHANWLVNDIVGSQIGSQALLDAQHADVIQKAALTMGIPTFLSGYVINMFTWLLSRVDMGCVHSVF